jgi:glycyl-tRNA synthetase beta chain
MVVRFEFAGVTSGKTSYGRPWMSGESVTVRSVESYEKDVSSLGVIIDDDVRSERIKSLAERAAQKYGLLLKEDAGLVDEICFMLEDPRLIVGEFPERYLRLPPEVVTTAMRSHQRYLALTDKRGRLVPRFITFTDGPVKAPAVVRDGNEKVLRARLDDALFYWNEDLKRGTDGLAAELERIVFIEGLGSLGEKSRRIKILAEYVNGKIDEDRRVAPELITRAAGIAKADLASEMIKDGKEFTLLQGLIGSHYARECGEDEAVARAVVEHYQPRTPADAVPATTLGSILSVADRIDTISGCFLAGFVPSGSQDPYGLRRSANGLVRILEKEPYIKIDGLLERSIDLYLSGGFTDAESAASTINGLRKFFINRCDAFLKERGVAYDVVAAVSRVSWMRPGIALERALGIARLRGDETFERLITGVKRVGNILGKEKRTFGAGWVQIREAFGGGQDLPYDTGKFVENPEHELYEAVKAAAEKLFEADAGGDFRQVLTILSSLADPIDNYFDHVLVNCEDIDLRENRHNFLASVFAVFARYADFLCIVEEKTV